MPEKVKPLKRQYDSTRRKSQALQTRRSILNAAGRLFLERGYSGTTIEAIAIEAEVAVETVYAIFRNKRSILARLFDVLVVGDEKPVPLLARPGPQRVQQERDQARQITFFAQDIREVLQRVGPLFEIMRTAAVTEPEIALLLDDVLNKRLEGMRHFVAALTSNGPLQEGIDATQAADTVWTLTSAEVYRLLTIDRGWSVDQYESWLARSLQSLLLPSAADQRS